MNQINGTMNFVMLLEMALAKDAAIKITKTSAPAMKAVVINGNVQNVKILF